MRERLIKKLDEADLFLRNRANAKPDPLNKYDISILKDIAKTCDEAARILEKAIVPPYEIGTKVYAYINSLCSPIPKGINECEIEGYSMGKGGIFAVIKVKKGSLTAYSDICVLLDHIYRTKEEAEEALKGGDE